MKICPVCNESFDDSLKFCDLDGARLTRSREAASTPQSKASLMGIGLLLGALGISAAAIIFFPKAPVTPPTSSVEAAPAVAPPAPSPAETAIATIPDQEGVIDEAPIAPVEVKKKEKPASEETNLPAPTTDIDTEITTPPPPPPVVRDVAEEAPAAVKPPEPPAKTSGEPRLEPTEKTVDPKAEAKKASKSTEKDADKKKDEVKEKKKGGFFGVFKKIFGKDEKEKKKDN